MILADKIIFHRKRLNLTQEELAQELDVSRQSVSKWEGAQTIPEMSKILLLSDLFGVSVDYLLRDEIEEPEYLDELKSKNIQTINLEFANQFMDDTIENAKSFATAVVMCILSPVILILFAGLKENNLIDMSGESLSGLGLIVLFIIIAGAVGLFIKGSFKMKPYDFISNEAFETEYGVEGLVKSKYNDYRRKSMQNTSLGVMLIILSVLPLFISELIYDNLIIRAIKVPLLLILIASGVYLIIKTSIQNDSYKKLLQIENFSIAKKKHSQIYDKFAGVYWTLVTGFYLYFSFINDAWDATWFIWPIAGVIFGTLSILLSIILKDD